jgi:N-acetyl-anhydromuramyl-L-alanine amidase AmpD
MSQTHIKEWQSRIGVKVDGDFGPATLAASLKLLSPKPAPNPTPKPTGGNPYTVKNHLLYKDGKQVSYQPSPNIGGVITPELIVIHYTGDNSLQGALSWLCAPEAKVSAHLVIAKTGMVWPLMPFVRRAWHAGASSWNGREDCNSWSIGIENVGLGDAWPDDQEEANRLIVAALTAHYGITEVVGHEDVAPGRKVDPGPLYPWDEVWPTHEG